MDLPRFILYFIIYLFTSLTFAAETAETIGIGFVHGTNDHRGDAMGGYWKKDFIQHLASALPNPENYVVVACDFRQSMWDEAASGCVADQLIKIINDKKLSKLIVYTHSNGANVVRWILSNPTYDPRFMLLKSKIKEVIALSPSSGGTPLADETNDGSLFAESLGWLIGYRNDCVRQQRVGDMSIYNDEMLFGSPERPSLPMPFRVVVSTDVSMSPFSGASYCNGYTLNAGLKITQLYLENCSDGFLNCHSQVSAGTVWFHDRDKTENGTTLSHNQSRHNCFGLGNILYYDLLQQGAAQ